jgi:hypothetical protein
LNLIFYLLKNGGKGNGKRYHASTINLFEVLQNFGGLSTRAGKNPIFFAEAIGFLV